MQNIPPGTPAVWPATAMAGTRWRRRFWPNAAGLGAEPEAGLFCVYSDNRETVRESARAFKAACENDALVRNLLFRAETGYGQREAT